MDRPQLAAIASDAADVVTNRWYNKLLPRASRPEREFRVQLQTVTIEEGYMHYTVSIRMGLHFTL